MISHDHREDVTISINQPSILPQKKDRHKKGCFKVG